MISNNQPQQLCESATMACDVSFYFHFPSDQQLPILQQNDFFIYTKPIYFTTSLSINELYCHLHVHCAVVLFNMALAHHQKSRTACRNSQTLVERALQLYSMSLNLIHNDYTDNDGPDVGISMVVKLAALNNRSELHFEMGNYVDARLGLDRISLHLLCDRRYSEILARLDDKALEGILLNILLFQPHTVAPAA